MKKMKIGVFCFILLFLVLINESSVFLQEIPIEPTKLAADTVIPEEKETPPGAPPKTIALGFQSGILGRIGLEFNIQVTRLMSLVPGFGGWWVSEYFGNFYGKKEDTNYCLLLRLGKKIYGGTGLLIMQRKETMVLKNTDGTTNELIVPSSAIGLPIIVGYETGNRRGNFIRFEVATINFISNEDEPLVTSGPLSMDLPKVGKEGMQVGIAFGRYIK